MAQRKNRGRQTRILAFSVPKARKAQLELSKRIILEDRLPKRIRLIAGVDVAYSGRFAVGAIAVLTYDSLSLVESQTAVCEVSFPYIPTFLSFREIPPIIMSARRLRLQPDVFLVDGQGYAHPCRCGLASHLGLLMKKPTIGVAKSRLIGDVEESSDDSAVAFLRDGEEIIGAQIRHAGVRRPLYVSVGHMVSLKTAIDIVRHCMGDHFMPEPILKAHEAATLGKRKINIG